MSEVAVQASTTTAPAPIASPGELLPYVVFAGVILMILIYFVGAEAVFSGTFVHEFVHDGRHLLGFPCH